MKRRLGKITNDLNDVIKARIASNLIELVRKENIQIPEDEFRLIVSAAQAAVAQVGLNAVATLSRTINREIENASATKSKASKRKR